MSRLLFLILLVVQAAFAAGDAPPCVLLLRAVAERHAGFSADDLAAYLAAPAGANPIEFASQLHPARTLSFTKSYGEAAKADAAAEPAVRAEAARLLAARGGMEETRDRAQAKTVAIPYPLRLTTLPKNAAAVHSAEGNLYFIGEKPYVAYSLGVGGLALVDVEKGTFEKTGGNAHTSKPPAGFEIAGRHYLTYGGAQGLRTYSLDRARHANTIMPKDPVQTTYVTGSHFFRTADGPRLLTHEFNTSSIAIVPLGDRQGTVLRPKTKSEIKNEMQVVDDGGTPRIFAPERYGSRLFEFDPITAQVKRRTYASGAIESMAFFSNGKRLKAFLATNNGLEILDPISRRKTPLHGQGTSWERATVFQRHDGRWYATAAPRGDRATDYFVLIDLQTEKVIGEIPAPFASMRMIPFNAEGRTYLAWGADDGYVTVIEPLTSTTVRAQVNGGTPRDIVPYLTKEGAVNALVIPFEAPPSVVQLHGPLR